MVSTEYAIAYKEVLEILRYIPVEDYNKISKERIELYETNADKDYNFNYNPNKTLDEQNVSKIAKGIIAILFRDYWATDIQRQKIIAKQNYDRKKIEEQKREKYNPDNIFKQPVSTETQQSEPIPQEQALVEVKQGFFARFISKIKEIFHVK